MKKKKLTIKADIERRQLKEHKQMNCIFSILLSINSRLPRNKAEDGNLPRSQCFLSYSPDGGEWICVGGVRRWKEETNICFMSTGSCAYRRYTRIRVRPCNQRTEVTEVRWLASNHLVSMWQRQGSSSYNTVLCYLPWFCGKYCSFGIMFPVFSFLLFHPNESSFSLSEQFY